MDAVSQVLAARSAMASETPRLLVSACGHAAIAAALWLAPGVWLGTPVVIEQPVMMVSLAGEIGPALGGRIAEAPRATAVEAAPPPRPLPEPPPPSRAPEMTEPVKAAPRRPAPVERPRTQAQAPATPPRATPTAGPQVQPGDAVANTGVRPPTPFGGVGSGGGTGARVDVVGTFCCPQYLAQLQARILGNWERRQQTSGTAIVVFRVQRDGTLSEPVVERSSGQANLDFLATRAVRLTRQVPPLCGQ